MSNDRAKLQNLCQDICQNLSKVIIILRNFGKSIYVEQYLGTFNNEVPRFLAIFDLPTYLVLLYNVPFWGQFWTPLPTLIWDVIDERSHLKISLTKW